MSSVDLNEMSSGEELSDHSDEENTIAYSLFDDYKSSETAQVYEHMRAKYGFNHKILGNSMLHRVALVNYLEQIRNKGGNVLDEYKRIESDPSIIMDHFEDVIKPPFTNEKLLWDFLDDEEDGGIDDPDNQLLSNYVSSLNPNIVLDESLKNVKDEDE